MTELYSCFARSNTTGLRGANVCNKNRNNSTTVAVGHAGLFPSACPRIGLLLHCLEYSYFQVQDLCAALFRLFIFPGARLAHCTPTATPYIVHTDREAKKENEIWIQVWCSCSLNGNYSGKGDVHRSVGVERDHEQWWCGGRRTEPNQKRSAPAASHFHVDYSPP